MPTVPNAVQFIVYLAITGLAITSVYLNRNHNAWARRLAWAAFILLVILVATS